MLTAMQHMNSTYAPPSTSPWIPANRHLLYDLASAPAPPPTAATHLPPHHHRATARRRIAKRRPRPSRRLPTTYISADPADFRRMVHQVTGADDLPAPPELLRPAPARHAAPDGPGRALLLPTLDTSAFLIGRAPPPPCAGSLTLVEPAGLEVGSSSSNCGFPTLESWDLL